MHESTDLISVTKIMFVVIHFLLEACMAAFKNIKEKDVHEEIIDVLKYAPHRRGGAKHKVNS